jgi:hypothetical protein
MLTSRLPLLPPDARVVSPDLAVRLDDDSLVVFNASGIIYSCERDDLEGLRLAAAMFTKLGLAKPTALARALEMHPGTVFRYRCPFGKPELRASTAVPRRGVAWIEAPACGARWSGEAGQAERARWAACRARAGLQASLEGESRSR